MTKIAFLLMLALLVAVAITDELPGSRTTRPPFMSLHAIHLAALTYDVDEGDMLRVAKCETGGTLNPRAVNRSSGAAGLFQFLLSTWRRTPFRSENRQNAYANSLAAGWTVKQDHG